MRFLMAMETMYSIQAAHLPEDLTTIERDQGYGWRGYFAQRVNMLLSSVTHAQVLRYFQQHAEWETRTLHEGRSILFVGPKDDDGQPIELPFPANDQFADYRRALEVLLNALSILEGRSVEEIIGEMRGTARKAPTP